MIRAEKGLYMIELLIALAISSMLSAAIVNCMAQTVRLASSGQNLIQANQIEDSVLEVMRGSSFAFLKDANREEPYLCARGGTYQNPRFVRSNGDVASLLGSVAPFCCKGPGFSKAANDNVFQGDVLLQIKFFDRSAMKAPDKVSVEVITDWMEGNNHKKHSILVFLYDNGIRS